MHGQGCYVTKKLLRKRSCGSSCRTRQFIVDFYCHEIKLVIEADGEIHREKERQKYDTIRTEFLESLGLTVLRFKMLKFSVMFVVLEKIKMKTENSRS